MTNNLRQKRNENAEELFWFFSSPLVCVNSAANAPPFDFILSVVSLPTRFRFPPSVVGWVLGLAVGPFSLRVVPHSSFEIFFPSSPKKSSPRIFRTSRLPKTSGRFSRNAFTKFSKRFPRLSLDVPLTNSFPTAPPFSNAFLRKRNTLGSVRVEQKFCVTAVVSVKFSAACHHPLGTNKTSPTPQVPSRTRYLLGLLGFFALGLPLGFAATFASGLFSSSSASSSSDSSSSSSSSYACS
mmetsp:Transcript_2468/g.9554  ORF Transcript_2468/g.9554 Transcript_2468/m.9554 type:complete len:239 (+) Transcript_2468:38-754(+)